MIIVGLTKSQIVMLGDRAAAGLPQVPPSLLLPPLGVPDIVVVKFWADWVIPSRGCFLLLDSGADIDPGVQSKQLGFQRIR